MLSVKKKKKTVTKATNFSRPVFYKGKESGKTL